MFAARHSLLVAQRVPPRFDTVGAGAGAATPAGSTWSANFTVTAGSYVFGVFYSFVSGRMPTAVQYGGMDMTLLASGPAGLYVFGLPNAPGDSQAFSGNRFANSSWRANVISFLNVGSVEPTVDTASGAAGSASQFVPCSPPQRILQVFGEVVTAGASMSSLSGGTNRFNAHSLAISDATGPTTFAATTTASWEAVALRMNPA